MDTALTGVAFANALDGWAVGTDENEDTGNVDGDILATTDGGATWTPQTSSALAGGVPGAGIRPEAVACADADDAWVVGYDGSPRQHRRWRHLDGAELGHGQGPPSRRLYHRQLRLGSGLRWHYGGASCNILATSDGGATWSSQDRVAPHLTLKLAASRAARSNSASA